MGPLIVLVVVGVGLAFAYDYYDKKVKEKK